MNVEFEFTGVAACRPRTENNCPEVATNVAGVVAFRDSNDPGTVVQMTPDSWALFTAAVKSGEFDMSA